MSIKTSIEVLAEPIGFDIAWSDDRVQANLLNGLGRGFSTYNEQNLHTQLCYVSQHLTREAKDFIKLLNEYNQGE